MTSTSTSTSAPIPLANLFIKNLHASINDNTLRDLFSSYGAISSAKVVRRDDGRSKEFGFVCFGVDWEAAFLAMANMNGRIIAGKPIYINIAQKKEQRKRLLAAQFGKSFQEDQEMPEAQANRKPGGMANSPVTTKEVSAMDRKRAIVQSLRVSFLYPTIADKIETEMMKLGEGELYKILSNTDLLREKIDGVAKSVCAFKPT